MRSRLKLVALGAVCMLAVAPFAIAQTTPQPNPAPAASQPADPMAPSSNLAPAQSAMPAQTTPATPGADRAMTPAAQTAEASDSSCHTRKQAGEQCSCKSAPTNFGTAQASNTGGRNVCMVPQG
jgi:hypothetical protein